MYRAIPVPSKICAKKWEEHCQRIHERKLRSIKKSVDQSSPTCFHSKHMQYNAKKEQTIELEYMEIDRKNRILLNRMSEIMKPTNKAGVPERTTKEKKTLNRPFQKKKLLQIVNDNQKMIQRISQVTPQLDRCEWIAHSKKTYQYYKNSCEYSDALYNPSNGDSQCGGLSSEKCEMLSVRSHRSQKMKEPLPQRSRTVAERRSYQNRPSASDSSREDTTKEGGDTLLYKNTKVIDNILFFFEIHKYQQGMRIIADRNLCNEDSDPKKNNVTEKYIEKILTNQETIDIFDYHNYNIESLFDALTIHGNEIIVFATPGEFEDSIPIAIEDISQRSNSHKHNSNLMNILDDLSDGESPMAEENPLEDIFMTAMNI